MEVCNGLVLCLDYLSNPTNGGDDAIQNRRHLCHLQGDNQCSRLVTTASVGSATRLWTPTTTRSSAMTTRPMLITGVWRLNPPPSKTPIKWNSNSRKEVVKSKKLSRRTASLNSSFRWYLVSQKSPTNTLIGCFFLQTRILMM